MPNDNPMDKLRTLLDQVKQTVGAIPGLRVVNSGFGVEQADLMQITIAIDPEIVFAPVEVIPDEVITEDELAFRRDQARYDAEFQNLITGDKLTTEEKEKLDAAEMLRKQIADLNSDDGLGFDD